MSQGEVDGELSSETSSVDDRTQECLLVCGPTILVEGGGDGVQQA